MDVHLFAPSGAYVGTTEKCDCGRFSTDSIHAFGMYEGNTRDLCPKGFVPKQGFGNQRICSRCDRPLEQHAVIRQ